MKATSEKMENCQVALNIEAEAAEVEKSLGEAYRRLVGKVNIAGFRKGKAPRAILEQHIGKDALLEEALKRLLPQLYEQALESQKIEPIAMPELEISQKEPLVFKAVVPVKPTVKLGDYRSIRLEPEKVEVGDDDIKAAIERLRDGQAVLVPVERAVQQGDFITIDIEASVGDKPVLNHKEIVYEVNNDAGFPLLGFAQQVEGMEKDAEKSFSLEVPADYGVAEFRGQQCQFKVRVKEVKEKELPALDNEFAQSCKYDDLKSMREKVTVALKEGAEQRSKLGLRRRILDAVVEISEVQYPPLVEDREIDSLIEDETRRQGYQKVEDYLKKAGMPEDKLKQELRPLAQKRVTNTLVLDKLAEEEKIEVSPAEVDNRIEEMTGGAGDENKEGAKKFFALPQVRESIGDSVRTQKTLDCLVQIVSGKQGEQPESSPVKSTPKRKRQKKADAAK